MKGFSADGTELKIQACMKRLTPSANRGDIHAFADGVRSLANKYGKDIADEAMRRMMVDYPKLASQINSFIDRFAPREIKCEFDAKAVEVMAEVLENAGLKLERNIRVSEQGVALTKAAVKAIAATGFPDIHLFGEGNDSIEEMGLKRIGGFVHPLSESNTAKETGLPDDTVNLWGVASVIISGVHGWIQASKSKCLESLKETVFAADPTIDLETLLRRSRYDDRVLLQLCNLAHDGLEKKAKLAMGHE